MSDVISYNKELFFIPYFYCVILKRIYKTLAYLIFRLLQMSRFLIVKTNQLWEIKIKASNN